MDGHFNAAVRKLLDHQLSLDHLPSADDPIWDDIQGLALLTDTEVLALRDYVAERDMMRSDDELSVDAADEKSASPSLETEVIASAENFSRCETRQASTKFAPVIEP